LTVKKKNVMIFHGQNGLNLEFNSKITFLLLYNMRRIIVTINDFVKFETNEVNEMDLRNTAVTPALYKICYSKFPNNTWSSLTWDGKIEYRQNSIEIFLYAR
jgi:hypothetical protein